MWNLFTRFFKCRHLIWLSILCVAFAGCKDDFDDSELRDQIADLDGRLTSLEKLCAQMNTNISSMQTIVNALQQNDYITGVTPIMEVGNTIGYTITFMKNKPITIYHGKDGEKGETGNTPKFKIENGRWLVSLDGGKSWEDVGQATGNQGETGTPGISPKLKIENGRWLVSFDEGTTWKDLGQATGEKGENGNNGTTPVIGVKQDTDGIYYWTLNGDWLLDVNNQKIKAQGTNGKDGEDGEPGQNAITPVLKIENGYWYVSYDNKTSWQQVGPSTSGGDGAFFEEVTEDENYVHMTLNGGTKISIPKYKPLSITFSETEDIRILPKETYSIHYTLVGSDANTVVKTLAQNGLRAVVKPTDHTKGVIEITTPATILNSEVLVFISDGKEHTVMSSINFVEGVINITTKNYMVEYDGGRVEVELSTNIDYIIEIPEEAKAWISVAPQSRVVMRDEVIAFVVQPNNTLQTRFTIVSFVDYLGMTTETILITQQGGGKSKIVHVATAGSLEQLITPEEALQIEELIITETLNTSDYDFIKTMPKLKKVDLTGVSDSEMPESAFADSKVLTVFLPSGLTKVPSYAFYQSAVTSVYIPETVTIVNQHAFAKSKITSLTIPSKIERIEERAFWQTLDLRGNVVIPNATTYIGKAAFANSGFDGTLTLGDNLKRIGAYAFSGCSNVTGDLIIPDAVEVLEGTGTLNEVGTFKRSSFNGSLIIGKGLKSIPGDAFEDCKFNGTLTIGENVTSIEGFAFWKCSGFTGNLIIPDKVTTIGVRAFWDCTGFKGYLSLGSSVTSIGKEAFQMQRNSDLFFSKIYSKARIAPSLYESFGNTQKFLLLVPSGSQDDYATEWRGVYSTIEEIDF